MTISENLKPILLGELDNTTKNYPNNRDEPNTDTKLNSTDVISQDRLDEILTKVNSFNFLSVLTSTSKDKYDKYKDEDNEYSFLYNDFSLKYEELKYKYEELDNINKNIIKQF